MTDNQLLQLISDANPVPDPAGLHPDAQDATPLLHAIYERSGIVETKPDQPTEPSIMIDEEKQEPAEPRAQKRWAWVAAAVAVALVIAAALGLLAMLQGEETAPVAPVDSTSFVTDLETAINSGDVATAQQLTVGGECNVAAGLLREECDGLLEFLVATNAVVTFERCQVLPTVGEGFHSESCTMVTTSDFHEALGSSLRIPVSVRLEAGTLKDLELKNFFSTNLAGEEDFMFFLIEDHPELLKESLALFQTHANPIPFAPILSADNAAAFIAAAEEYASR